MSLYRMLSITSGSQSGDDDDFIVPDDEDDDDEPPARGRGRTHGRSSSTSSRSSVLSEDDFDEEDDDEAPSKTKRTKSKATPSRPALKSTDSGRRSSDTFLTAAEQRMQAQKNEKKSTEEPFSFLVDPRDVRTFVMSNVSFLM